MIYCYIKNGCLTKREWTFSLITEIEIKNFTKIWNKLSIYFLMLQTYALKYKYKIK